MAKARRSRSRRTTSRGAASRSARRSPRRATRARQSRGSVQTVRVVVEPGVARATPPVVGPNGALTIPVVPARARF